MASKRSSATGHVKLMGKKEFDAAQRLLTDALRKLRGSDHPDSLEEPLRRQIQDHFNPERRYRQYEREEWTKKVTGLAGEIAQIIDLTGVIICGIDVAPRKAVPATTPQDMETRRQTFEETRKEFREARARHIQAFQDGVTTRAGEVPASPAEKRRIIEDVNQTRRELAVALGFRNESNQLIRVTLSLASNSFQLRATDSSRTHVHSSTDFPRIEVIVDSKEPSA